MFMRRIACLLLGLAVLTANAQDLKRLLDKAPPGVEEALRARVMQFYGLHQEGKFRQAETLVAEDSKDIFYAKDKNRMEGYEIREITYSENFTRAKVLGMYMGVLPMMGVKPVPIPSLSNWKLADGQWFWFVDQSGERRTPFGVVRSTGPAGSRPESAPSGLPSLPGMPAKLPSQSDLAQEIQLSKDRIKLSATEPSSDELFVINGLTGPVTAKLHYSPLDGFEAVLQESSISGGGRGRITFRMKPSTEPVPPGIQVRVVVEPVNKELRIPVFFERPDQAPPTN